MPLDFLGAWGILDEIVNIPGREDPVEQRINDGAGDKSVQVVEEIELRHAGRQRHGQVDGRDKAGQGWGNPHGPLWVMELASMLLTWMDLTRTTTEKHKKLERLDLLQWGHGS
jgi:hypothetical protein